MPVGSLVAAPMIRGSQHLLSLREGLTASGIAARLPTGQLTEAKGRGQRRVTPRVPAPGLAPLHCNAGMLMLTDLLLANCSVYTPNHGKESSKPLPGCTICRLADMRCRKLPDLKSGNNGGNSGNNSGKKTSS